MIDKLKNSILQNNNTCNFNIADPVILCNFGHTPSPVILTKSSNYSLIFQNRYVFPIFVKISKFSLAILVLF